MTCKICERELETNAHASTATGVCTECRTRLGVVPLPPSRRRPRPCVHCQGQLFVRAVPRELTAVQGNEVTPVAAPMTASTIPVVTKRHSFGGKMVKHASVLEGAGTLEMYICMACGFVEWHCQDPEAIPIGPEYMTEIVDFSPASPYRG